MTAATEGTVGVSITAGHLKLMNEPPFPRLGRQLMMGDTGALMIHINPATAKQWLTVLTPIAESEQ